MTTQCIPEAITDHRFPEAASHINTLLNQNLWTTNDSRTPNLTLDGCLSCQQCQQQRRAINSNIEVQQSVVPNKYPFITRKSTTKQTL